jgi:hypothetical protein
MNTLTAAEYREMAAESRQRSLDLNFDADGFFSEGAHLSIAAARTMASRYEAAALFVEEGERLPMTALFNLDGTVASTHQGHGQYGEYWVLNDEAAERFGKRFFSPSQAHKNLAADRKRGFTYGTIMVPGYLDKGTQTQPDIARLRAGEFEVVNADDNEGRVSYCVGTCCGGEG